MIIGLFPRFTSNGTLIILSKCTNNLICPPPPKVLILPHWVTHQLFYYLNHNALKQCMDLMEISPSKNKEGSKTLLLACSKENG